MKKKKFEILVHGTDHEQYFPGCGTAFSDFENVVTGIGMNAKESYEDAVEQIYQILGGEEANKLKLPKRPKGISRSDRAPVEDGWWYYVSIRY